MVATSIPRDAQRVHQASYSTADFNAPRNGGRALGSVMIASAMSLVLTLVLLLNYDMSLVWAVPAYSLMGTALTLLLLLFGPEDGARR